MKLTKEHRACLLHALEQTVKNEEINRTLVEKEGESFEIYHFLDQQRRELIHRSLIDNEIDY